MRRMGRVAFLPVVGQAFLPVSPWVGVMTGGTGILACLWFCSNPRISGRLGDGRNAIPLAAPTTGKNAYPTRAAVTSHSPTRHRQECLSHQGRMPAHSP